MPEFLDAIFQHSVFSRICLSKKLLSLLMTTECGILARELIYRMVVVSGLNCTLLGVIFFLNTFLNSQYAKSNFNGTKKV